MKSSFVSSGDEDIDRVRKDVAENPTDESNYEERLLILYMWRRLLQRQGADTSAYIPAYDKIESAMSNGKPEEVYSAIDEAFPVLEEIQTFLSENPPTSMPPKEPVVPGEPLMLDWPVYGGNPQHTGYTEDLGPVEGKLAWRFPVGFAWYSRPAIENGRVYAASPGMRTILYCLDVETGRLIWKTPRIPISPVTLHYATPSVASSPVVLKDMIVLSELGACHLIYVDKKDGKVIRRVQAGAEYPTGCSIVVGNEDFLVFPDGTHLITETPPQISSLNKIVCKKTSSGETIWDFLVGPTFCEPLLDENHVYVGTLDGVFLCLNTWGRGFDTWQFTQPWRIAWQFKAGGPTNSAPTVWNEKVYFGANDGVVYCLNKRTGEVKWKCEVEEKEPRAFKFFSTPTVAEGKLYIGAANKQLYCLDAETGKLIWKYEVSDWIRSRPACQGDRVYVAAMNRTIHCLSEKNGEPQLEWKTKVGTHPIFSDLVFADGKVFVSSSDLYVWCLDASDGTILWRHSLLECIYKNGERVPTDQFGHCCVFQSKPTVAAGKVFVGTRSRFVYAVDFKTGRELWKFELGGAVSGAPAYSNGRVFFGQQGGEEYFYCVDAADGSLVWRQTLGWVWSSANVFDGKVFVPGVDGYVNCLREEDGAILWRYRAGRAAHPEPPVDDGKVYFGSWDHYLYAIDTETGKVLWKFHTGGSPDSGAPIAYKGKVYLPLPANRFRCLDGETGKVIWEFSLEEKAVCNASPAIHNDRLFISVSVRWGGIPVASKIYCLDAETGRVIWEHRGGGLTAPAVADGKVYFASTSDPFFYCVDEKENGDGTTTCLWKYKMGDRVDESCPAISGGRAFILCADGYLYAFE